MIRMKQKSEFASNTLQQLLHDAVTKLSEAEIDTPTLNAEVMLSRAMKCSRTDLLVHQILQVPYNSKKKFEKWVYRRSKREPLAYIIGEREFYSINFEVTPDVLIPRQETEILVEVAIQYLKILCNPIIADIGVGSGAIAVSVAKNVPDCIVYGTDISDEALDVSRRNADSAGVGGRVHLSKGDLFEPLAGMIMDMIVSNPPYIPSDDIDKLQPEISKYEPRQALDGGPDGLDQIRRLAAGASTYLKKNGIIAVEVGAGQSDSVIAMFEEKGFRNVRSEKDYSGIERVVLGEKAEVR